MDVDDIVVVAAAAVICEAAVFPSLALLKYMRRNAVVEDDDVDVLVVGISVSELLELVGGLRVWLLTALSPLALGRMPSSEFIAIAAVAVVAVVSDVDWVRCRMCALFIDSCAWLTDTAVIFFWGFTCDDAPKPLVYEKTRREYENKKENEIMNGKIKYWLHIRAPHDVYSLLVLRGEKCDKIGELFFDEGWLMILRKGSGTLDDWNETKWINKIGCITSVRFKIKCHSLDNGRRWGAQSDLLAPTDIIHLIFDS